MKTKIWLVKYTIKCGGYEFSGQTLVRSTDKGLKKVVHRYLLRFYEGTKPEFTVLGKYVFHNGEIVLCDIRTQEINDVQAATLQELEIAFL